MITDQDGDQFATAAEMDDDYLRELLREVDADDFDANEFETEFIESVGFYNLGLPLSVKQSRKAVEILERAGVLRITGAY